MSSRYSSWLLGDSGSSKFIVARSSSLVTSDMLRFFQRRNELEWRSCR